MIMNISNRQYDANLVKYKSRARNYLLIDFLSTTIKTDHNISWVSESSVTGKSKTNNHNIDDRAPLSSTSTTTRHRQQQCSTWALSIRRKQLHRFQHQYIRYTTLIIVVILNIHMRSHYRGDLFKTLLSSHKLATFGF